MVVELFHILGPIADSYNHVAAVYVVEVVLGIVSSVSCHLTRGETNLLKDPIHFDVIHWLILSSTGKTLGYVCHKDLGIVPSNLQFGGILPTLYQR
jgi:hypothetical protein